MKFWKRPKFRLIIYIFAFLGSAIVAILEYLKDESSNFKEYIAYILLAIGLGESGFRLFKALKQHKKRESAEEDEEFNPSEKELLSIKQTLLNVVERTCHDIVSNEIIEQISSKFKERKYLVKLTHNYYLTPEHLLSKKKGQFVPKDWDIQKNNFGLVFIGEPGNGKTYRMTSEILEFIEVSKNEISSGEIKSKIPVYLSLSTWNGEYFKDWLTDAIVKKYQLSKHRRYIKYLLANSQLIPCVDGLDEVQGDRISECLQNIIDFAPTCNIVFACRREEFMGLLDNNDGLSLAQYIRIISLEKLSKNAIEKVLTSFPDPTQFHEFLETRQHLYEYINTPLFLNLFIITYQSFSEEEKQNMGTIDQTDFENKIWSKYDEMMFKDKLKGKKKRMLKEELITRTYLTILANKMTGTAFYINQLQPLWLPNNYAVVLYYLLSRSVSGLFVAIATGFIIATPFAFIGNGLLASLVVVFLTLLLNSRLRIAGYLNKMHPVTLFTIVLIITTATYQGFSIPRSPDGDMRGSFSLTESFSGILLGLFFGSLFGYRKRWQNRMKDIQPLEKFHFQWKEASRVGIRSGLGIGLLMGLSGVIINYAFSSSSFGKWLKESALNSTYSVKQSLNVSSGLVEYFSVFVFGFSVGFLVGGLIFVLMGGRKREEIEVTDQTQKNSKYYSLNFGIRKSLLISLRFGLISFLILSAAYSCFIFFFNRQPEGFIRAVMIGTGTCIISFLWFGGIEVIQHWALRICLYVYGLIPIKYSQWIGRVRRLAFLRKVGASLEFYHPTLKDFYKSIQHDKAKITNVKKTAYLLTGRIALLCILLYFILVTFYNKYNGTYWSKPAEIDLSQNLSSKIKTGPADTAFIMLEKGILKITIANRVYIGTFTGSTGPEGTETGIFGFPMRDVYDLDTSTYPFRHAALLYKIKNNNTGKWQEVIPYKMYIFPWEDRTGYIPVSKGDTMILTINDREWQNNRGHFTLKMDLLPDSSKTTKQIAAYPVQNDHK